MSTSYRTRREGNWLHTFFKKAHELSVLTDSKVAILLKTSNARLYEFVSTNTSMEHILKRYKEHTGETPSVRNRNRKRNGNGMPPKVDIDIPPLKDNTPDDMTDENLQDTSILFQNLKLSKSDIHMILDSYTNEEIEQFEQELKQAKIKLLEQKVELVKEQVQYKGTGEKSQSGAGDCEEIRFEVARIMEVMASSGARDGKEIRFEVESTNRTMEVGSNNRMMEVVSPSRARDREEIRLDVGSSSRTIESQNMELDLELCLGFSSR